MSGSDNPFHEWISLEQPRLGSRVVFANDEFFGAKERLIDPAEPVFIDGKYDDHGKWMDGWETRRKREAGHDYCIVKLGIPGVLRGVNLDTRYFTGNFPPAAMLEGCVSDEQIPGTDAGWHTVLPKHELDGDKQHFLAVDHDAPLTHLKLHIYPDGGIARLRLYGEVRPDFSKVPNEEALDLLAVTAGGRALACSDEHYGSMHNLNVAGRGVNMGDGWETARRRGPGHDWVILGLGHPGVIENIEIDTAHFKGNYPARASIDAVFAPELSVQQLTGDSLEWLVLLPESKLQMDNQHYFSAELRAAGPVSHLRLNIYPDGGVSRLRAIGKLSAGGHRD